VWVVADWVDPNLEADAIFKRLGNYLSNHAGELHSYTHGDEVTQSLQIIYGCAQPEGIAHARPLLFVPMLRNDAQPALRPDVIEALRALSDIAQEYQLFERSSSLRRKTDALNRAAGALQELSAYVAQMISLERRLLNEVVERWQDAVATEQGKLGALALQNMSPAERRELSNVGERQSSIWQRPNKPFDNPYVVGDPVSGRLFVGRNDLFNRIAGIWAAKPNPDSIILYGHRRMGKSSILRNLSAAAPEGSLITYIDLMGEAAFVQSIADFLLGVADKIQATLQRALPEAAPPLPDPSHFSTQASARIYFERFMGQVREALAGRKFFLVLDEFEALEKAVQEGKLDANIYPYLRARTQEPWITLVMGGKHTLDEMTRDYEQPFHGSYTNLHVSYLSHSAAAQLIANPAEDFDLDYAPEAIERIITATGGQPYLIQLVCQQAVELLNHELFDRNQDRDDRVTLSDIETVINAEDFFVNGTVYFDGVWDQTEGHPQVQALLLELSQRDTAWTEDELRNSGLFDAATLEWAKRRDILRVNTGEGRSWEFCVPLMSRFLQTKRASKRDLA